MLTEADRRTKILGEDAFAEESEPVLDGGGAAIDIAAPADLVWQHLKQMGQDRAGWYSFEGLERLFTFDIHNHYTIHPEWQDLKPGDFLFYHQPPLGVGSIVTAIDEENRQMATVSDSRWAPTVLGSLYLKPPIGIDYFAWSWNFAVLDYGNGTSRYLTKAQVTCKPFGPMQKAFIVTLLGFPSYFMLSRQCDVLKQVCEGRMPIDAKHA